MIAEPPPIGLLPPPTTWLPPLEHPARTIVAEAANTARVSTCRQLVLNPSAHTRIGMSLKDPEVLL